MSLTDEELYAMALKRGEAVAHNHGRVHCDCVATCFAIEQPDGSVRYIAAEWSWPKGESSDAP